MADFSRFTFPSADGRTDIVVREWTPSGPVRGTVQITHGIAEHSARYADFAQYLADAGYVVSAMDLLGHGESVADSADLGFFAEKNGWNIVLTDMKRLRDIQKRRHNGCPTVLFGHSMGSFLSRNYVIRYPRDFDCSVFSGTGHMSRAVLLAGKSAAEASKLFTHGRSKSKFMNGLAFGKYNDAFKPNRTEFDWLSRDNEQVDRYIADPLCGFAATDSLIADMMGGLLTITAAENIRKMDKTRPVLLVSGDMDPVGENGKGVKRAYDAFRSAGIQDVTLRLYEGARHEILNETNRDKVFSDILKWINTKTAGVKKNDISRV